MNRRTEWVIVTILVMLLGSTLRQLLRAPKELDRLTVTDLFGLNQDAVIVSSSSSPSLLSADEQPKGSMTLTSVISNFMMIPAMNRFQRRQQQQQQQQRQISRNQQQQQKRVRSSNNITIRSE